MFRFKLLPPFRFSKSRFSTTLTNFTVVAYESGHENPNLPTWYNTSDKVLKLENNFDTSKILRKNYSNGIFQLFNVLTPNECDNLVNITENLGYTTDAPVSLPYYIRHMSNCNWIISDYINETIFNRCYNYLPKQITLRKKEDEKIVLQDKEYKMDEKMYKYYKLLSLNSRFRFYRYEKGDYFAPHTDGSWPHSKVVENGKNNGFELISDYFGDRYSQITFLLLLSDDYIGGKTIFHLNGKNSSNSEKLSVKTPKGGVLCFFHGFHPLHSIHEGEMIEKGVKYMIRTELLYQV